MFKYRLPSRTGLFTRALEFELRKIRQQLSESTDEGFRGLVGKAMSVFRSFILTLGKPRFSFLKIDINNNFVSRSYYNETRKTVEHDLTSVEQDVSKLGHASIESFNVAKILATELDTLSLQVGSKARDLAIITKEDSVPVLVAGDDFTTRNGINISYSREMPAAFVDVNQGLVSLARTESTSVIDPDSVKISIKPVTPGIDNKPQSYKNNLGRFYEGRYYALAGQAEPEGGKWHLEELTSTQPDNGYYYSMEEQHYSDGSPESGLHDSEYAGDPESVNPIGAYVDDDGNIVIKNEIIIHDRGATEGEKEQIRKRMVDGNPDTYWQCEYVLRPSAFGVTKGALNGSEPSSSTASVTTDLRGEFTQSGGEGDARLQITPDDLRAAAITYDNLDLEVAITVTLPDPVQVNWINMIPMNFGETAWLKITNIEIAETRNGVFVEIPNFNNGRSQNILTEDVNSELLTNTAEYILSPSRYVYRGSGVWTFPIRRVQVLRFTMKQDVPTPALYQKIQLQMHRIWERTKVHTYDSDNRSLKSENEKSAEWTTVLTLDYLKSVQIMQGSLSASEVAPATAGDNSNSFNSEDLSVDNSSRDLALDILTGSIFSAFGGGNHNRTASSSRTEYDSGFYMNAYWVETFYDLIAYRIGIRELSAFQNLYEKTSEIVSTPYYSPVDIEKIVLRVDDNTPSGTDILYYISPDDGKSWYEINPLDKPSRYSTTGFAVPKTISFNIPGSPGNEAKYVTTETTVKKILFKAVFSSENNIDSPVLRSYRILIYPIQSFSPREFES